MGQAVSITELLASYFREQGLEQTMLEDKLISMWAEVMGPQVARLTENPEIKDGVLYVRVRSAALRQQLFECRSRLVQKLNDAAGGKIIKDIRLQ